MRRFEHRTFEESTHCDSGSGNGSHIGRKHGGDVSRCYASAEGKVTAAVRHVGTRPTDTLLRKRLAYLEISAASFVQ
jgi:hypothetical protein